MPEIIIAQDDATGVLDILALRDDLGDSVPLTARLMACAWFTTEQLQDAWAAFCEAVRWREALACGSRHWGERFDEADLPRGGTPSEAALDLACLVADEAKDHLLNGGSQR